MMNFTTTTAANNNNDDDEVQSAEFSDFDEPYHETASNWLRRSARRRARRLAGLSSCSSSSSSDESIDEEGSNNNTNNNNNNATIIYKPIMKWQRQYPVAAARACLSLLQLDDDASCTINSHRSRSPRERECNRLHRVLRKIHRKQSMHLQQQHQQQHQQQQQQQQKGATISGDRNEDDISQRNDDKLVIDSFLPNGTGISFIDSALSKDKNASSMRAKSCSLVMELTGGRRSGRTATLLAIAARYVASTTSLFFPDILECEPDRRPLQGESSHRPSKRQRRDGNNNSQTQSVVEPRIIVLDIDHCFNPIKLMLAVREAVLRRFHETSVARKWVTDLMKVSDTRASILEGTTMAEEDFGMQLDDDGDNDVSAREKKMIDHAIASCLGRINIVQPKDFTYLTLVATLESLRQSLDQESKHTNHAQTAPTMIMIDSMSTLDASTQYQESLPTKGSQSGLSDRNEFYRQLIRLRDSHQVAIIGTSLTTAGRCSIWDKMITNRVSMQIRIND